MYNFNFKVIQWTKEVNEFEDVYRSTVFKVADSYLRFDIVESGDRFYPIWSVFPAEGFETLAEAKEFAQASLKEAFNKIISEFIDE